MRYRPYVLLLLATICPATVRGQCCGDCNGDGSVVINELVAAVNNALGGCAATPTETPSITAPTMTVTSTPSSVRFIDNGDGTVTDTTSGLIWEKKTELNSAPNAANLHDADNPYNWSGFCSLLASKRCQPNAAAATACAAQVDGDLTGCSECMGGGEGTCTMNVPAITTIFDWIAQLNAAGFAGHRDWRVPTREELISIVNYRATSSPAAFAAFHGASCGPLCTDITDPACSCTALFCWSASAFAAFQGEAWEVDFNVGSISVVEKSGFPPQPMFVRAVRGGEAA